MDKLFPHINCAVLMFSVSSIKIKMTIASIISVLHFMFKLSQSAYVFIWLYSFNLKHSIIFWCYFLPYSVEHQLVQTVSELRTGCPRLHPKFKQTL